MYFSTTVVATLFAAGQLLSLVQAHVEMKSPVPFRSKFLVPNGPNTDFTNTAPLNPDGSNFPCKGYHHDTLATQATLTAGSSFTLELSGSATHNGGSCQVSVSYDGGQNFIVIHSIVGGCPVDTETYTIPVPSDLPAGDNVLLAWTWVNHTGNREFYMNCSPVKVIGTSSSFTGPRIFEANIFGQGTCNTVEGVDVVYPNPGKSVAFGGSFKGGNTGPATTLANCPFDQNVNLSTNGGTVSAGSSSSNSSSTSSSTSDSSPSNSDSSASSGSTTTAAAAAVQPAAGTASADVQPAAGTPSAAVKVVATTATIVSVQTAGVDTPSNDTGSTSDSTSTSTGGSCTDNGAIHCGPGGTTFYMCSNGELINMGSVAAGTHCSNGQISRKRALPPQLHRRKHAWVF